MKLKVSEKASSDSDHLLKARASWMCCSKTCQPGFADLTLPLSISNQKKQLTKWSPLIEKSKETFAIPLEGYKTEAIKAGNRLVLNLTPIDKKQVKFTKSLQFFSADGLIHSDEKQIVKRLKNGAIQFDMVISEFGPKDQETLEGILYTKKGYDENSKVKPYRIKAAIKRRS